MTRLIKQLDDGIARGEGALAAFILLVMVVLALTGGMRGEGNTAHFAHLGGFAGAFLYMRLLDVRSPQNRTVVKQKVARASRDDLDRWAKIRREQMHEVNREEFDRIMEKIDREGIASVTPQERIFLDNFSERATASS